MRFFFGFLSVMQYPVLKKRERKRAKAMQNLEEKFLKREEIYNGKVLHVVKDTVIIPNGEQSIREFCMHVGAVSVLPLLDDGTVIMERQYRYAHGSVLFEIPAGKLNSPDEDRLEAAKRELREETGAVAQRWTDLGLLIPTPALVNERIQMFLAEDITFGKQQLDDDEFLELERIPLSTLKEMVMRGEIPDAKTQICILKVAEMKKLP